MKKNTLPIFILFLFSFCGLSPLIANTPTTPTETPTLPDPLDLTMGWWDYFNTSSEELKPRVDTFKQTVQRYTKPLNKQEHETILDAMSHTFLELDTYLDAKRTQIQMQESNLQFRETYTIDQLLNTLSNLEKTASSKKQIREKIEIKKDDISRVQKELDQEITLYQNTARATHDKLLLGLRLMEKRTLLEIKTLNLQTLQEQFKIHEQEEGRLKEELEFAKTHLSFKESTEEKLKAQIQESKNIYEQEKAKLYKIEKEAFFESRGAVKNEILCCLWEHKVLSAKIKLAILRLQPWVKEIEYYLFNIFTQPQEIDTARVQEKVAEWKEIWTDTQANIKQWSSRIKEERAKVSQTVASLKKEAEGEPSIHDATISKIHLTLDECYTRIEQLKALAKDAELLYELTETGLVQEKTITETWSIVIKSKAFSFFNQFASISSTTIFRIKDHPVSLATLLKALLIFFAAVWISSLTRKGISKKLYFKRNMTASTEYIIQRCIHYIIIIIGIVAALAYIGLDFTNLAIVAGALGVGIGFGMQSIVNNILSGILLLIQRRVKVGDVIELGDQTFGNVSAINLQNTYIRSFDGADLLVPNSELSSQVLRNWTMKDSYKRFRIPFGVAYGTDKNLVRKVVIEAAKKLPCTLKDHHRYPDPQVWLAKFGDSSLDFELVAWVDLTISMPNEPGSFALRWAIDTALNENGIEIPFPQRDVYIKEQPKPKID